MTRWKGLILGGLTFLVAHFVEVWAWSWFDPTGGSSPWFLNAGRAVAFTAASLLLAGAIGSAAAAVGRLDAVLHGCNIAVGAAVAMTVVLFATGPGTLFPIVLVFGAAIAVISSVSGAILGWALTSAYRSGLK